MSEREKRLLVATGGTGGHIFPAVAVAEEAKARGWRVLFVGGRGGLEERLLAGYDLELLPVDKWKRERLGRRLQALALLPAAVGRSLQILRSFRPQVVVGAGGYVAGPVAAAAAALGRPVVILEQNAIPGSTNRLLGRFAAKVAISFRESANWFGSKAVFCGNPVRRGLRERPWNRRVPEPPLRLAVFGGSQGARAVNDALAKLAPVLADAAWTIRHQTGPADLEWVRDAYEKWGVSAQVEAFVEDVASWYEWADLALCRAGATTLAELWVAGLPAVLVPFPYAADNHQTANALVAQAAGAAVLVSQGELTTVRLRTLLDGFAREPERLREMAEAARRLARPQAAACVLELCEELAAGGASGSSRSV